MKIPFTDFLAVHDSLEKRELIGRLEKALADVHHSGAFLSQQSGVAPQQIRAMLSCDIKSVSQAEIKKVLAVAGAGPDED
jgi:hypothetical protein